MLDSGAHRDCLLVSAHSNRRRSFLLLYHEESTATFVHPQYTNDYPRPCLGVSQRLYPGTFVLYYPVCRISLMSLST